MKHQILFVDDEQNLLSGLQRMFRPLRERWDMEFLLGGRAALERVNRNCFDVVVTDMKMPELDGAQVLEEIKKVCPFTIRMVLSGQAESEAVNRALKQSHQYMAKPCKPEDLQQRIQKACTAREMLNNLALKEFVTGLDSIPILPVSLQQIGDLFHEDKMGEVARVVSRDIGMSAKVLQMVNSDYFGSRKRCNSAEEACHILGADVLQSVIRETDIFTPIQLESSALHFLNLSLHSGNVARTAMRIAALEGGSLQQQQEACTAGLLHEIGRLVLVAGRPAEYQQVVELIEREECSHSEAELQVFGSSHSEVGAYLAALWGLSDDVVEAIAYQTDPKASGRTDLHLLTILHAANALEDEVRPLRLDETRILLDEDYLQILDTNVDINQWRSVRSSTGETHGA